MSTKTQIPETPQKVIRPTDVEAPSEPTALEEFINHQRKAFEEARKALIGLLPESVQTHTEAAIKESVEGYRMLVNTTLDDIIEALKKVKLESVRTHKGK